MVALEHRMTKLNNDVLKHIQGLFQRYEQEILRSEYSTNSKSSRVKGARDFVNWLSGQYSPGDYRPE